VTVLEVIQRSTEFLAKKGVDSPRLQTELLLAHLLELPRMKLYLDFERRLTEQELNAFRELVRRRGLREPLQHITGSTSFCGLEIAVSSRVLIPRPETELLAEQGWLFLQRLAAGIPQPPAALDFGTGSGCLAVALAVKCPVAEVFAVDISAEAIETAQQNAGRHGVQERIRFFQSDGFRALSPGTRFDLIISNPPYIPTAEIGSLQPEVRDFDPRRALDGGPQGLDFYARLAAEAPGFLQPGGKMMLEIGDRQVESLRELLTQQKWIVEEVIDDYTQRPRVLVVKHKLTGTGSK
jgi:release factor glutamine methyltransferase